VCWRKSGAISLAKATVSSFLPLCAMRAMFIVNKSFTQKMRGERLGNVCKTSPLAREVQR
jgi:hypothetical protein